MSDSIYADTGMLSSFSGRLREYCMNILQAANKLYSATRGLAWSDDLTDRAVEHYAAIARIAERILQTLDGCDKILADQLVCLIDYEKVSI